MEVAAEHQFTTQPFRRAPELTDYLVFFVGIPASMAFLFSMVGIKLITGMDYLDGFMYMLLHMFLAWYSVYFGALAVRALMRRYRPSIAVLVVAGFFVSLLPTVFFFRELGDAFAAMYPIFAENRASKALPAWSLEYIAHFARYSTPAIPLFLAGVLGYRYVTGVDWLGYPARSRVATIPAVKAAEAPMAEETAAGMRASASLAEPGASSIKISPPMAGAIAGSRLPSDAEIFAIKAEQHYIKIWSAAGTDLVRYRFRDLEDEFADCNAAQVHRSWWVNFDRVDQVRRAGRSIELVVADEMVVPVSLSHKTAVLSAVNNPPLR